MQALSVAYQDERPELKTPDITVLVPRALREYARDACDAYDASDASLETPTFYVASKDLREAFDRLAEQSEVDIGWMGDADRRTMRVGRLLGTLRLEKARTGDQRRWLIRAERLEQLLVSYGSVTSSLDPHGGSFTSVTSVTSVTPERDGDNGGRVQDTHPTPAAEPDPDAAQGAALTELGRRIVDALAEIGEAGWPTLGLRLRADAGAVPRECEHLVKGGHVRRAPGNRYTPVEQQHMGGQTWSDTLSLMGR